MKRHSTDEEMLMAKFIVRPPCQPQISFLQAILLLRQARRLRCTPTLVSVISLGQTNFETNFSVCTTIISLGQTNFAPRLLALVFVFRLFCQRMPFTKKITNHLSSSASSPASSPPPPTGFPPNSAGYLAIIACKSGYSCSTFHDPD